MCCYLCFRRVSGTGRVLKHGWGPGGNSRFALHLNQRGVKCCVLSAAFAVKVTVLGMENVNAVSGCRYEPRSIDSLRRLLNDCAQRSPEFDQVTYRFGEAGVFNTPRGDEYVDQILYRSSHTVIGGR